MVISQYSRSYIEVHGLGNADVLGSQVVDHLQIRLVVHFPYLLQGRYNYLNLHVTGAGCVGGLLQPLSFIQVLDECEGVHPWVG